METIGAYEAKTHLPKLLDRVSKGERIIITRHGVPVAVLQPPQHLKKKRASSVIAELREFREQNRLNGLTIRELIEQGRR